MIDRGKLGRYAWAGLLTAAFILIAGIIAAPLFERILHPVALVARR